MIRGLAVVLLASVGAGTVLFFTVGWKPEHESAPSVSHREFSFEGSLSPRGEAPIDRALHVFRRPRDAKDIVPDEVAGLVQGTSAESLGALVWTNSRVLLDREGKRPRLFAIPTSTGFVCFALGEGLGLGCATSLPNDIEWRLQGTKAGSFYFYGIVTDSVSYVGLGRDSGRQRVIEAVLGENGFLLEIPRSQIAPLEALVVGYRDGTKRLIDLDAG